MRSLIAAISILVLTGCTPRSSNHESLLELQRGMSRQEVEQKLDDDPTHQFAARIDGQDWVGVSHEFRDPFMRFYFIYRANHLEKIVDALNMPPHSNHQIDTLLNSASLTSAEIKARVLHRKAQDEYAEKHREPSALLAAQIVTAPFAPLNWVRDADERARLATLRSRFDPNRATLGMSRCEVDTIYGAPRHVLVQDCEIRIYGDYSGIERHSDEAWVAVVLANNCVSQILSHSFFNPDWRQEHAQTTTYD